MGESITQLEASRRLGVSPGTIINQIRRLGLEVEYGPILGSPRAAKLTPAQFEALRADIEGRRRRRRATPA